MTVGEVSTTFPIPFQIPYTTFIQTKNPMPFQQKFTNDDLITFLSKDGDLVTIEQVKDAAQHFGVKVQSVTKRINQLSQFDKVTRGTWRLSVAEALEKTYQAKSANKTQLVDSFDPSYLVSPDLTPDKDPNFVPFGNFSDVKKIINSGMFYPTFITGFLVMVRHLVWSKHVLN